MADKSAIEWTDATWNPIVGCSIVSPGCTNCYAMKMAGRIEAMGGAKHYAGTTKKVNGHTIWTGKLALAPEKTLLQPLAWRTPRRIFVNSMGDLFHEDVPDAWIDKVFAVMALAPQHTFQVLTKRAKRMREYVRRLPNRDDLVADQAVAMSISDHRRHVMFAVRNPLRNVWWLGVSAERQQEADERIPELLATPAHVRFVSAEPLLGPINIVDAMWAGKDPASSHLDAAIDWIIAGGESGPGARPMHPAWARSLRDQCQASNTAFFFKQWGAWRPTMAPGDDGPTHWLAPDGKLTLLKSGDWWPVDGAPVARLGKKLAGRQLDFKEHNEQPQVAS